MASMMIGRKSGKLIRYPISERALIQRINRNLVDEGQRIKKTREGRARRDLGWFYVLHRNTVIEHHLGLPDLVAMAKKLGVMADYENLVPDDEE